VLLTTGYAQPGGDDSPPDPRIELLAKPFEVAALAAKVREMIDRPRVR
jgi:hypothetical protein